MADSLRSLVWVKLIAPIKPISNGPKKQFADHKFGSRKAQVSDKKKNMINLARLLSNIFRLTVFLFLVYFFVRDESKNTRHKNL